jgi:translation initiation factor IF-1
MLRSECYRADAVIVEVWSERVARAELGNGHRFVVWRPGRGRLAGFKLAVGQRIAVEFSPCDLSKARMVTE